MVGCVRVVLAGTGAALHPSRSQSSIVIDTGSERIAVDYGCGAPRISEARGVRIETIDAFIVTHMHYDHICGIPHALFLGPYRRRGWSPLVAVPPGWEDSASRLFSSVPGAARARVVPHSRLGRVGDVRVEFGEAIHTIEASQVMVEYGGIRVLISGDTRPTSWFRERAATAHLAVHEATAPSWQLDKAEATGHSTVTEAVAQVEQAGMGVLYHLTPDSEAEARQGVGGRVIVPEDGLVIRLC